MFSEARRRRRCGQFGPGKFDGIGDSSYHPNRFVVHFPDHAARFKGLAFADFLDRRDGAAGHAHRVQTYDPFGPRLGS